MMWWSNIQAQNHSWKGLTVLQPQKIRFRPTLIPDQLILVEIWLSISSSTCYIVFHLNALSRKPRIYKTNFFSGFWRYSEFCRTKDIEIVQASVISTNSPIFVLPVSPRSTSSVDIRSFDLVWSLPSISPFGAVVISPTFRIKFRTMLCECVSSVGVAGSPQTTILWWNSQKCFLGWQRRCLFLQPLELESSGA